MKKQKLCPEAIKNRPVGVQGKFCALINGQWHTWFIQSLIKACDKLPVTQVDLKDLDKYLLENAWFHGDNKPTVRSLIDHYKRSEQSDLCFPIIVSTEFGVMDGLHRIVKAHITGCTTILAVYLDEIPEADYIGAV